MKRNKLTLDSKGPIEFKKLFANYLLDTNKFDR